MGSGHPLVEGTRLKTPLGPDWNFNGCSLSNAAVSLHISLEQTLASCSTVAQEDALATRSVLATIIALIFHQSIQS